MHATYGPGSRKRARSDGRSTMAITAPTGKKMDVYLDANAAPKATPVAVHQANEAREPTSLSSARTTQYSATASAARTGTSGVASTRPAAESGRLAKTSAARSAAREPATCRADMIVASDAMNAAMPVPSRRPNAEL